MEEKQKDKTETYEKRKACWSPFMSISGDSWIMDKKYRVERRNFDCYLLLYTTSGEGYLFYEEKEYRLLPGTAFLIDCNQFHIYQTVAEQWGFVFIHFKTDCLRDYVDELYNRYGAVFSLPAGNLMERRMRPVISLCQMNNTASGGQTFGLMAQILSMLYVAAEQENDTRQISDHTDRARQIIEKQYAEKLTLDRIARDAGCSKYYLSHQFKADIGITIYGYLTYVRIHKSKILLQSTNLSVADIAEKVGFPGVSNFIRTFSAQESMTPHQYRKQWQ